MRRISWALLLLYVFTIPWEYSLDLGAPFGNIARIVGLALLLIALPAVAQAGYIRALNPLHWLTLALFAWFTCTGLWSPDRIATLSKLRSYLQEMMIIWFLWEFLETSRGLRAALCAWLAGSWVLAALTIANAWSGDAIAAGQTRFAAIGQDPNDVARFLNLGFPIAALLIDWEGNWPTRFLAIGYFPIGIAAVLLTASRGGFVAALASLLGSAAILHRDHFRALLATVLASPLAGFAIWLFVPHDTLGRLATLTDQLRGGDLNQRLNIWEAGWRAFTYAPFLGHGAGSFVSAAGLAPVDTAHNTALSILVESGVVGLSLFFAIIVTSLNFALRTRGALRSTWLALLATWAISSCVGTTAESRTTWLLFGIVAVAARLETRAATGPNPVLASLRIETEGAV